MAGGWGGVGRGGGYSMSQQLKHTLAIFGIILCKASLVPSPGFYRLQFPASLHAIKKSCGRPGNEAKASLVPGLLSLAV